MTSDLGGDRHHAYHALRAVLPAARDRLTVKERHDPAAQLPMLLRGPCFEGYTPVDEPLGRDPPPVVAEGLGDTRTLWAEDAARAVFRLPDDRIARDRIDDVAGQLPADAFVLRPRRVAGSVRERF